MSPPWVDDKPGPEDPLRDVDLPVVAAIVEGPGTPDPGCPVAPVWMEVGDSGTNKRANKQRRAWIVLGWETTLELHVLLTKTKKLGSVAGACKPSRCAANSFKAYRLWESLDFVLDSLLATAAKWSPKVLAT